MSDYSGDLERRLLRGLRRGNQGTDYSIPQGAPVGQLEFPKAPEFRFQAPRGPRLNRDFSLQRPDYPVLRSPGQALFGNRRFFQATDGDRSRYMSANKATSTGSRTPSILDEGSDAPWLQSKPPLPTASTRVGLPTYDINTHQEVEPPAMKGLQNAPSKVPPGTPYGRVSDQRQFNLKNLPKPPAPPPSQMQTLAKSVDDFGLRRAPGIPYGRVSDQRVFNAPKEEARRPAPLLNPSEALRRKMPGIDVFTKQTGRPVPGINYSRTSDRKEINAPKKAKKPAGNDA